ncbi:FAD-dependent oxidoreductase [Frankia sp. Cas3]|uniref:FAD-dependent oxidoreductase n=1 Tax=Frankia sp. Cas3 TaxID=3073926 RepID=UPI003A0FEFCA
MPAPSDARADAGHDADVIVVGAGPAGSAAALVAARAGKSVLLLERGPFPGSKNLFGGVVYGRVLDDLVPDWAEQAPIQRWVTRRQTMILTGEQALSIDYRNQKWGRPPYNGATTLRPDFDAWFAGLAEKDGATLVTSTVATGLLRDPVTGRITGVRTDRPDGNLSAPVVIAADGVNSFLAKEAGLYPNAGARHFTLGAKEVLSLPRGEIDARFGVRDREGVDIEILGGTGGIAGGGFVYTNLDTISVGVVLSLPDLAASRRRPEEIIAELKAHPAIHPLVEGGELVEYGAHLIPEGGYDAMPALVGDGMLVTGDAAAMCLAAGIWLEGVNFAIASGAAAGQTAVEALDAGDTSARGLAGYRRRLESSFVLADHKKLRRAPALVLGERTQQRYPDLICGIVEDMFTVTNPRPKRGLVAIARARMRGSGVTLRDLVRDGTAALRTFG